MMKFPFFSFVVLSRPPTPYTTLDTCRSKAKTILQDNGIKLTNFEMTYNFEKELVLPGIKKDIASQMD